MFYSGATSLPFGPSATPFYAVHWTADDGSDQDAYYVVPAAAMHFPGSGSSPRVSAGWYALSPDAQLKLAPLAKTLQPFVAGAPMRVTVGGKAARDPAGYSLLWSVGKAVYAWPSSGWLRVRIYTQVASPWQGSLLIARRGNLLQRDGTVFAIRARVAAHVRARLSLR